MKLGLKIGLRIENLVSEDLVKDVTVTCEDLKRKYQVDVPFKIQTEVWYTCERQI